MNNKLKKLVAAAAALAVAFTTVAVTDVTTAKAAEDYTVISTASEVGYAGVETKIPFAITKTAGDVWFYIRTAEKTGVTVTLYDSTGKAMDDPLSITSTDQYWEQLEDGTYTNFDAWKTLEAGNYTYGVKFDTDHAFDLVIAQYPADAKISQSKAVVTAGFTYKLSVSGSKATKWSSSKKSVATVDSKGKVTGKKAGKTTISAKCENGQTVKCTVTVKANKYSAKKITTSDVYANAYGQKPYSASFDKNGNLVVKVMIVNNGYGRMTKIPKFKVTVKNQNGKTVGTYSKSSFSVSVPSYSAKSYTVTIKKSSKLSSKKVDLVNSTITSKGGTATVYY